MFSILDKCRLDLPGYGCRYASQVILWEDIPPMQDVIDLAVNQNDLYLLHADNHVTTCAFSALIESPTRCEDRAVFSDPRPGRQSGPLVEERHFHKSTSLHPRSFALSPDPIQQLSIISPCA
jgi:hypothetical protein